MHIIAKKALAVAHYILHYGEIGGFYGGIFYIPK